MFLSDTNILKFKNYINKKRITLIKLLKINKFMYVIQLQIVF